MNGKGAVSRKRALADMQLLAHIRRLHEQTYKNYGAVKTWKALISSYYGYRKPDSRLFKMALDRMDLEPHEVIGVGNDIDMFRDVGEAGILGIKSIFFDSNQGTKTFENVSPDYRVSQFDDVLKGLAGLS